MHEEICIFKSLFIYLEVLLIIRKDKESIKVKMYQMFYQVSNKESLVYRSSNQTYKLITYLVSNYS